MIPRMFPIIALVSALLVGGCGAMAELEEENHQLSQRLDALELENAECAARLSAAAERMSVLEQENLRLDEVNRQITQRQTSAPTGVDRDEVALPPPIDRTGGGQSDGGQSDARAATTTKSPNNEASASPVPPAEASPASGRMSLAGFQAGTAAGESFLTRYQAALTMYNSREFEPALAAFATLVVEGHRNDMIDNCGYWIGECHYALGRYDEALRSFSDVIAFSAVSDKFDDALMMRGNCHVRMRNYTAAQKDFQTLIAIEPPSELRVRAQQKLQALR